MKQVNHLVKKIMRFQKKWKDQLYSKMELTHVQSPVYQSNMFRKAKNVIRGRNANNTMSSDDYGDSDNERTAEGHGKFSQGNLDTLLAGDEIKKMSRTSPNNSPFGANFKPEGRENSKNMKKQLDKRTAYVQRHNIGSEQDWKVIHKKRLNEYKALKKK